MAENKEYMTSELEHGAVNINEDVITTIAVAALKDIDGVVCQKNDKKVVRVLLGEKYITVECNLTVLYGHSVVQIAKNVQTGVTNAIESMTGFTVRCVDVNICAIAMAKA
jgi:uncharacterized alkaline shock family protein YloU